MDVEIVDGVKALGKSVKDIAEVTADIQADLRRERRTRD